MSDEKPNINLKGELYLLGKGIVFIVTVITALWFFGRAPFNEKVDERIATYIDGVEFQVKTKGIIKTFLNSAEFQVIVDDVIADYEAELAKKNSDKVPLRKLLAIKMQCDEDEVHIRIGKIVVNEKELIKDIQLLKKKIQKEVERLHPNTNLNID